MIGTDWIYASFAVVVVKLLKLTVNMKPPAMTAKLGMMAIGAPVDAVPGIFGRNVVAEIPVLVYFFAAYAVLLAAAVGVPTTIVAP